MGINELIQVGNQIRKCRLEKGLSQKAMAKLVGIPYSTYSNYENNNREPSLEQLKKIANALDVSVEYLTNQTDYFYIAQHPSKDAIASSVFQTILDFYGDDFTEEEIEDIRRYIEFVKSKRKNLQSPPMKTVTTKEVSVHLGTDVSNLLNAAHADDYENAPEELKKKEEDIMDDENF